MAYYGATDNINFLLHSLIAKVEKLEKTIQNQQVDTDKIVNDSEIEALQAKFPKSYIPKNFSELRTEVINLGNNDIIRLKDYNTLTETVLGLTTQIEEIKKNKLSSIVGKNKDHE